MRIRIAPFWVPLVLAAIAAAAGIGGIWAQAPAPGQYGTLAGGLTTAQITLSAAQIDAMFTTPVLLIPAQGPGTVVNIQKCLYNAVFGSAAFTGGGGIGVFYGVAASSLAGTTTAATLLTTFAANQSAGSPGTFPSTTIAVNMAVYVSNQTGVFAGGAGSSMIISCQYSVTTGMQ